MSSLKLQGKLLQGMQCNICFRTCVVNFYRGGVIHNYVWVSLQIQNTFYCCCCFFGLRSLGTKWNMDHLIWRWSLFVVSAGEMVKLMSQTETKNTVVQRQDTRKWDQTVKILPFCQPFKTSFGKLCYCLGKSHTRN